MGEDEEIPRATKRRRVSCPGSNVAEAARAEENRAEEIRAEEIGAEENRRLYRVLQDWILLAFALCALHSPPVQSVDADCSTTLCIALKLYYTYGLGRSQKVGLLGRPAWPASTPVSQQMSFCHGLRRVPCSLFLCHARGLSLAPTTSKLRIYFTFEATVFEQGEKIACPYFLSHAARHWQTLPRPAGRSNRLGTTQRADLQPSAARLLPGAALLLRECKDGATKRRRYCTVHASSPILSAM